MKKVAVILTKNWCEDVKLVLCQNKEEAADVLKKMYLQEIHEVDVFDYNNTFLDEEGMYAQVTYGLEATEIRVANVLPQAV